MKNLKRQIRKAVCYVEMAALILACAMFGTACSSGEENNSASQSADAQQPQQQQPQQPQQGADVQQQPQQQTQAPAEQADTTGYDWSQIPSMPERSYITVDGANVTEGMFYYTSDGDEALIMAVFVYNGANYAFGVSIEEEVAKEGAAFNNSEAYDKGCEAQIVNLDTGEDFQATDSELHIGLYKYTSRQYVAFYVKLSAGVTIEMAGEAQYVDQSQVEAALSGSTGNGSAGSGSSGGGTSSTCRACYGTGKCSLCHTDGNGLCPSCNGAGYFGDYNHVCYTCGGSGKCNSCNGSGVCKYCGGTGVIQ